MIRGVFTLAAVALVAFPALAEPVVSEEDVFLATQSDGEFLAKDLLLTAKVQNADGQIIGDVEDLILNADNQVVGVVMGTGGFAGFGEKRVGVRLSALQIEIEDGTVTITLPQATKETLDALEPFKRTKPPKSLLDRAIEKAKELTDKGAVTAKDAYGKAKEEAGPALKKAREAVEEAYEEVKEKAAPALEKTKEAAKEAYDQAREAIETRPSEPAKGASDGTTAPSEPAPTPQATEPETQP